MGNIIFRVADFLGDGYNPIIDNLICASENIGTFPVSLNNILTPPICFYNQFEFPLRTKFDTDISEDLSEKEILEYSNENFLDIEKINITESEFDHIFPVYMKSSNVKEFESKSYYCINKDCKWLTFFNLVVSQKEGYTEILNEKIDHKDVDNVINRLRTEKIVLKSENYAKEIIEFYMTESSCKHDVDFYLDFFIGNPLRVLALCNNHNIDVVVKNYIDLLLEGASQSVSGKRTNKPWIVDINFATLFESEYNIAVNHYEEVCNKLDIVPNLIYFENLYNVIRHCEFAKFMPTSNPVLIELLEKHAEH